MGGYAIQKLLNIAAFVILARFLTPTEFGIMALVLVLPKFIESISDTGLGAAVINYRGDIHRFLNSVWTIHILKSVVIALLIWVAGPYIAKFYHAESARLAISLGGIFIVILNASNIGEAYLLRDLAFHKITIRDTARDIAYITGALVSVYWLPSYWALFIGTLCSYLTQALSTYILHPYRPRLSFTWAPLKELTTYGSHIAGQNIFQKLYAFIEVTVVNTFTDANALGLFTRAKSAASIAPGFVGSMIRRISFPAYSRLKDDLDKVNEGVKKSLDMITFFLAPITIFMIIFSQKIILFLLGAEWVGMVPLFQLFLLYFFISSINDITQPITNALERPGLQTILEAIRLVIVTLCIIPLTRSWDTLGATLAITITSIPLTILAIYWLHKLTHIKYRVIVQALSVPLGMATLVSLPLLYWHEWISQQPMYIFLGIVSGAGVAYLIGIYCLGIWRTYGPYPTILLVLKHWRN